MTFPRLCVDGRAVNGGISQDVVLSVVLLELFLVSADLAQLLHGLPADHSGSAVIFHGFPAVSGSAVNNQPGVSPRVISNEPRQGALLFSAAAVSRLLQQLVYAAALSHVGPRVISNVPETGGALLLSTLTPCRVYSCSLFTLLSCLTSALVPSPMYWR